jgi:hypothetical protein
LSQRKGCEHDHPHGFLLICRDHHRVVPRRQAVKSHMNAR